MATTGALAPGTVDQIAAGGNQSWSNPDNVKVNDGSDSILDSTFTSGGNILRCTNFGLSIPTNSTFQGVIVSVEASEHSVGTLTLFASLTNSGGVLGTSKSLTVDGLAKSVYTFGTSSDVWGATLTPTIVNDSSFGIRIWIEEVHEVRIDYITFELYYTEPFALTASDLAANDHELGSPALTQKHILTASDLAANDHELGSPALGQIHVLTASDLAANDHELGSPALGQIHVLTASDLVANPHEFDSPSLSIVINLTASDLVANPHEFESPVLGQVHILTASDLVANPHEFESPILSILGEAANNSGFFMSMCGPT